jgi:hypothetical protein
LFALRIYLILTLAFCGTFDGYVAVGKSTGFAVGGNAFWNSEFFGFGITKFDRT